MSDIDWAPIYALLNTTRQSSGKTSLTKRKRFRNIEWIRDLERDGLQYNVLEKAICMHTTPEGEKLYIQYPGKESISKNQRPWDFRPVCIKADGTYIPPLSFEDVWDTLLNNVCIHADHTKPLIKVLSVLFYRMAYMFDHKEIVNQKLEVIDVPVAGDICKHIVVPDGGLFVYALDSRIIEAISGLVPTWCGMSFEAFMRYNDLLAWNEDCKYYYRNLESKDGEWINDVGRVNNLLTHVGCLGFAFGVIKPSTHFMRFAQRRGTAAATYNEILAICGEFFTPLLKA